jgi:hypothetical protein
MFPANIVKTVEGNEKQELQDLQERLESKIRVCQSCINLALL